MLKLVKNALVMSLSCAALAAPPSHAAEPTEPAAKFAALTAEAEAAYAAKNYQGAIAKYLDAFAVIESPDVLYNVAVIYEDSLHKRDLAKNFYERIVRNPDSRADLVRLATDRLADLDKKAAEETVRPTILRPGGGDAKDVPPTVVAPAPASGPGIGPWLVVAAGGALMVVGVIEGVSALDAQSTYDTTPRLDEASLARARDLADSGGTKANLSDAFLFGGGAVALTGLIWYLVADRAPADAHGAIFFEPRLGPGAVATDVGVRF